MMLDPYAKFWFEKYTSTIRGTQRNLAATER
jgi:hypothetical protein